MLSNFCTFSTWVACPCANWTVASKLVWSLYCFCGSCNRFIPTIVSTEEKDFEESVTTSAGNSSSSSQRTDESSHIQTVPCELFDNHISLSDFDWKHVSLGSGSFGGVWEVTWKRTGQKLAMKIVDKRKLATKSRCRAVQYVLNELEILTKVCHPFVVQLHCAFQDDNVNVLLIDFSCCLTCFGSECVFCDGFGWNWCLAFA